jgi:hypothetical protein
MDDGRLPRIIFSLRCSPLCSLLVAFLASAMVGGSRRGRGSLFVVAGEKHTTITIFIICGNFLERANQSISREIIIAKK